MKDNLYKGWLGYRDMVVNPDAGPKQRAEIKKAFYGGAAHMFKLMAGDVTEMEDPEAMKYISALQDELAEFIDDYRRKNLEDEDRRQSGDQDNG